MVSVCLSVKVRCGSGQKRFGVRIAVGSRAESFGVLEARFGVDGNGGDGYVEVVSVRAVSRVAVRAFYVAEGLIVPTDIVMRFAQLKVCRSLPVPKPSTLNPDHQSTNTKNRNKMNKIAKV